MEKRVDLHLHSTASDGSLTPEELVAYAREKGAAAIALTDHDTVDGVKPALEAGARHGLEVVPGVEISALHPRGTMHILGYFIDPDHPFLQNQLDRLQVARRERNPRIIQRLKALGIPITWESVAALARGQIGRPHIAQALVRAGAVTSVEEAFEKYLTRGAPAYVEKFRFPPSEAIEMIRAAGGLAVLAHPFTLNLPSLSALEQELSALKALGLEGVDGLYPEHKPGCIRCWPKGSNWCQAEGATFTERLKKKSIY